MRFDFLIVFFFVMLICIIPVSAMEVDDGNCTLELECVDKGSVAVSCDNLTGIAESENILSSSEISSIECDDFVKIYGNNSNFVSRFYNNDGLVLNNTEVFFNFAGEHNSYYTDDYGFVSISVNNEPGIYYLGINNPVTEDYVIKKITVLPQIESHNLVKMYGTSDSFVVRILGLDGLPVGEGQNVTFRITGSFGTVTYNIPTDSNGYSTRTIGLIPGKYNVTTEYNGVSVNNTIKVLSRIESSNLVKMYGNSSSFIVRLLDLNGNPVGAGVTATFKIYTPSGTVTYNIQTDSEGYAVRTIGLVPGSYTITTTYAGVTETNTITVLSPIVSSDLVKYYKNDSSFVVRILGLNGSPVGAGENVTFTIAFSSGTVTYNIQTDSDGYAVRTIGLVPGSYTITTAYGGVTETNTITVLSTIVTSDLTMAYNDGNYFSAIILDGKGNPYPNQNVTFKINSATYDRVTDDYGLAIRTIGLAKGTYTIQTIYDGLTVSNTLVVGSSSPTHRNTNIQSVDVGSNIVNPCNLTVRLADSSNNYLSKKSVLFKFNDDVCFNRLTDNNGYVYFNDLVPMGTYNCNISFSGDTYYTKSSIVNNIQVDKRATVLSYEDMGGLVFGEEIFNFTLKDTLGNSLSNQNILVNIGNNQYSLVTNNEGNAYLQVNLEDDTQYNVTMEYSGNSYYYGSYNNTIVYSGYRNFTYSILIPNNVDVTNPYWTIYDNYYTHPFVESTGLGGIIHMPIFRNVTVIINGMLQVYYVGYVSSQFGIAYGESEEIVLDDGILQISSNYDFTNITYSSFIRTGVNQVSAVYMDSLIFDEEWVLFVNGENKLHIGFSSPWFLDEEGVRFGYMGNQQIQVSTVLNTSYNSFSNFDSLVFADTGESVEYSSDFMNIANLPSREKVKTVFSVDDNCFVKDEWMNFENNDHPCGIDFVQSYAVSDCLVNPSMVEYLLNFSDNMISNAHDTGFASFLTALSCFWMFDESASQLGDIFNVSVNRENCAVVMSGMDCDSNAYVHVLDPVLGLNFSGEDVNNTYFCQALSSLLLGDIEARALGLSGRLSNSSLNVIFSEILNGGNFTLLYENGTIIVQLTDNDNCSFVFDIDSGLVYDLSYYDNFTYKGAISTETNECCPYIFLYSIVGGLYDALRYKGELPNNDFEFELSDRDLRGIAEIGASVALSSSAVILKSSLYLIPLTVSGVGTVPLITAVCIGCVLIGVGFALNFYAKNGNYDEARKSTVEGFITSLI